MTAVSLVLAAAAVASAAAFLSNSVSGIDAIIEFGIAAAMGLLVAYMVLGWVAPKLLLALEERMGPRPEALSHTRTVAQKIGFVIAAFIAGTAVTMAIVFPAIGWAVYLLFLALFIYVPYRLTRRRNARAAEAGLPLTDEVKGAGHGFRAAGTVVHFLARWRVFTLPAVAILAVLGLLGALQVESGFEIKDFFSSKTNFVVSLDKLEEHWGSGGGDFDYIFVEGDLTEPQTLVALEAAQAEIDASEAQFVHDFNGDVEFNASTITVVRLATASETMQSGILAATGVEITDTDNDGLADSPEQIAAIYDYAKTNDLTNTDGAVVFRPRTRPRRSFSSVTTSRPRRSQ